MKHKNISTLLLVLPALTVSAAVPAHYYDSLEGLSGVQLKKAVKAVARNHRAISYGTSTWEAFLVTDTRYVNGKRCWWDMYSSDNVAAPSATSHDGMNIEHSVANSWWGGTKNDAYKDIVHLNPSNSNANSRKSNYPLGEISTHTWDNGITFIGKPASGTHGGATYVYEPHDMYKGDFARVFMYMFTIYDDIAWKTSNTNWMYDTSSDLLLKPWAQEMLLRWSAGDEVSDKERDRNDGIYSEQGNRNPFIDLPHLADHIWGSKKNQPFHVDPSESGGGTVDPVNPPVDPEEPVELFYADFEDGALSAMSNVRWAGTGNGWYDKTYDSNHYATVSTYSQTAAGGPYEYWLVTPVFSHPADREITLTFRTQGAYHYEPSKLEVFLLPSNPSYGDASQRTALQADFCVPNENGAKPVYSDWVQSGDVLLPHVYDNARIGFRFTNPSGGNNQSSTYCLDDVRLVSAPGSTTAVETVESDDDSFLVEVWGNNILVPDGAHIFSINGTEVSGCNLAPGIYVVVKPTFAQPVKIMIK